MTESLREYHDEHVIVELDGWFILADNFGLFNEPCALCGFRTEPEGYDIQITDESYPGGINVCDRCADRYVPDLQRIRRERRGRHEELQRRYYGRDGYEQAMQEVFVRGPGIAFQRLVRVSVSGVTA